MHSILADHLPNAHLPSAVSQFRQSLDLTRRKPAPVLLNWWEVGRRCADLASQAAYRAAQDGVGRIISTRVQPAAYGSQTAFPCFDSLYFFQMQLEGAHSLPATRFFDVASQPASHAVGDAACRHCRGHQAGKLARNDCQGCQAPLCLDAA
jgi:hypothetical protein